MNHASKGDGKVLTSNADGLAEWKDAFSGLWGGTAGSDIYYNTGNVGIGTTNPSAKLEVAGNVMRLGNVYTGTSASVQLTETGGRSGVLSLRDQGTDKVSLAAYPGQKSFINNGGNVGIGTTTPQEKLHVVGEKIRITDSLRGRFTVSDQVIGGGSLAYSIRTAGGGGWAWQFVDGNDTAKFHVASTGDVGIGTTSPSGKLDISTDGTTGSDSLLNLTRGAGFGGSYFKQFYTDVNNYGLSIGWISDRLTINQKNGFVGIGTTSPGAKLSLSTPNNTNADLLSFDEGTSKVFTFQGQFSGSQEWDTYLNLHDFWGNDVMTWRRGRVGIGETDPAVDLHIHNDVNSLTGIRIQNDNTGANANMRISFANAQGTQAGINLFGSGASAPYTNSMNIFNNRTDGGIRLSTEGIERVHLDNSGKLGIGTHTPGRRLHVKALHDTDMNIRLEEDGTGTEYFDIGIDNDGDLNIARDSGETALSILDSNGNVGIRTNSPVTSLQINSTTDASLSNHGAMVLGAATGTNIVMDNNEIIARNNGSASTLYVNKDGGNVILGNSASKIGIGTQTIVSTRAINTATGAYLTTGGTWTSASSRELKENINKLTYDSAFTTLMDLTPVTYNYKVDKEEAYVGFIAEDVPELVATNDRKGLAPMDIVAVLTKVTQKQQEEIDQLKSKLAAYETKQSAIEDMLLALSADLPKEKLAMINKIDEK